MQEKRRTIPIFTQDKMNSASVMIVNIQSKTEAETRFWVKDQELL